MLRYLEAFDHFLERISRWGLVSCLFVILILAVVAILLRFFGATLLWVEPFIRHVVFLSAFLGGSLATSKGVHIKVDILTHVLENSSSKILVWLHQNFVTLFCLITCLILTRASWDFYLVEKEFGTDTFLSLHTSHLVAIIPFGVGLISLRFFNRLFVRKSLGRVP